MGWKKCPKCDLNWIEDDKEMCDACAKTYTTPPKPPVHLPDRCYSMLYLGTRAYDIYCAAITAYGFRDDLKGSFAPQKPLYAEFATKERYNVWFIAHSNWNGTITSSWDNCIQGPNNETIVETFLGSDKEFMSFPDPNNIRVSFIKDANGSYYFLGVYEPNGVDREKKQRFYKKISDVYPIK